MNGTSAKRVFQRNYFDHIIRDDIDKFFVEQYIEHNPVLWDCDVEHPGSGTLSIDEQRGKLMSRYGLSGYALEKIVEYELLSRDAPNPKVRTQRRSAHPGDLQLRGPLALATFIFAGARLSTMRFFC